MPMDGMTGWPMINVVSSVLIVALFAFWVRELKHQILGLRQHAAPALPPPAKPAGAPVHHAAAPVERRAPALVSHHPAVQRTREGNVPVWTIE
jgi:hypothetical protein